MHIDRSLAPSHWLRRATSMHAAELLTCCSPRNSPRPVACTAPPPESLADDRGTASNKFSSSSSTDVPRLICAIWPPGCQASLLGCQRPRLRAKKLGAQACPSCRRRATAPAARPASPRRCHRCKPMLASLELNFARARYYFVLKLLLNDYMAIYIPWRVPNLVTPP